jgi:hypothetical protein
VFIVSFIVPLTEHQIHSIILLISVNVNADLIRGCIARLRKLFEEIKVTNRVETRNAEMVVSVANQPELRIAQFAPVSPNTCVMTLSS